MTGQYVRDCRLYDTVQSKFNTQEEQLLLFYANNYSPSSVAYISVNPPNHVIAITNWELMAALLRRLGPAHQKTFLEHWAYLTYEGKDVTAPLPKFDETYFFL